MMPDLSFRIEDGGVQEWAAAPSLSFRLAIDNRAGEPIRSISLDAQVRILANRRGYSAGEKARLWEVFGQADRWSETQQSLLWTHAALTVPAFTGSTVVEMPVPCTYDFDVVSAKYFHNLEGGEIPLEFLFSGSVFYAGEGGLQVVQIPWDREARFALPVRVWKQMMDAYFPNSAWLRVHRDVFDRLYDYKMGEGLPTWDAALERLLRGAEGSK